MFKTLRRASILLSMLVLATMLTSTALLSESTAKSRPDLAQRGEALLQAVDFRVSNGLAQFSVTTGPDDVYIVRLDLAKAMSDLREPANYRLALVLVGLWVFLPALISVVKHSRNRVSREATSRKPGIVSRVRGRYHRVHGLTVAQLAFILKWIGACISASGANLIHLLKGNIRVKRYRPRHAVAGRRHKTMIIEAPGSSGFAA